MRFRLCIAAENYEEEEEEEKKYVFAFVEVEYAACPSYKPVTTFAANYTVQHAAVACC